jgi:hypothetical protein
LFALSGTGSLLTLSDHSIIDIAGSTSGSPMNMPQFGPVFVALWHRQLVECISTKRAFVGLPRPTLAVISVRRACYHFGGLN